MNQRHEQTYDSRYKESNPWTVALHCYGGGREGSGQHYPFKSYVDDSTALRVHPAEGGKSQRGRISDHRSKKRKCDDALQHCFSALCTRRSARSTTLPLCLFSI